LASLPFILVMGNGPSGRNGPVDVATGFALPGC